MAPLPDVPQVLKIVINGTTTAGRDWANILHAYYTGTPPSSADLNTYAEHILGIWAADISPYQHPDLSLTGVQITDLTSATSAQGEYLQTVAGLAEGDVIPAGAACLVQYDMVDYRWRGGHPRQYLPVGVQSDLLNTSQWTEGFAGDIAAAWTEFLGSIFPMAVGDATVQYQVIVSYRSNNEPRTEPVVVQVICTGTSQTVASQRRRTRKRS